ncbi:MlaD family protein [Algoriphagus hitonicola]|uniref:Phospholipid/cholesterol/gamma-HCH transport system substrate-binding protein n=1 Tax=Algoriphagus hitonicola TaxID=435880 RepID=A0A1I2WLR6_9BACT|nr:MlaD family protein [Algoriphagus hitonicola]SFH02182.1 phospholipid/cholesterol/gamma-HCH transport system substrate-binding protein [Algoriphagus hitonicola]
MKKEKQIANAKLGFMVLAGLIFLVFSLYMIGRNQNIFGTSFRLYADIENINGLLPGNNVRFRGMDVGTVSGIEMLDDQTIRVELLIHKSKQQFIGKNYEVAISTDGLMGNKVLQVLVIAGDFVQVEEGDVLQASLVSGTDEILERLDKSGEYLEKSLINIASITEKLNENNLLWDLLADEELTLAIKTTISEFRAAGSAAKNMTLAGQEMMTNLEEGEGLVNSLFTDTTMVSSFEESMESLVKSTAKAEELLESLTTISHHLEEGKGTAGMLLNDTTFQENVSQMMLELKESSEKLNENLEAMRSNFLFRRYFKKQEKESDN